MTTDAPRRPLVGEPPALDLLNSRWAGAHPVDLLDDLDGLRRWLTDAGLPDQATEAMRTGLVETRDAINRVLADDATARDRRRLDAILDHGRVRLTLTDDGRVDRRIEVDGPAWRPAVLAAHNLLELLEQAPDRIHQCEHPNCIMWFWDTSRNGTRRWCSMAGCGNRAKAQRHYARAKHD